MKPQRSLAIGGPWWLRQLVFINAAVLCIATLALKSTFANLFGASLTQISLGLIGLSILVGCVLSLPYKMASAQIFLFTLAVLFYFQLKTFELKFGYQPNFNMIFSFLPAFSFILFANPRFDFNRYLRFFFWVSISYSLLYVVLYASLNQVPLEISDDPTVKILASDGTRDTRVYLAGIFPAYALFYALIAFKKRFWIKIILAAVPVSAVFLAQSRAYTFILILAVILNYLKLIRTNYRSMLALAYVVFIFITIAAVAFDFNIYSIVSSDASGSNRYYTFDAIKDVLSENFILGAGLPSSRLDEISFFNSISVYWSDTGPIGIWFAFGFFGLLLFALQSYILIRGMPFNEKRLTKKHYRVLMLVSFVTGLGSIGSPAIWISEAGLIMGLVFALWLRDGRLTKRENERNAVFRRRHPTSRLSNSLSDSPVDEAQAQIYSPGVN